MSKQLLKEHDIRFWQFEPDTKELIYWSGQESQSKPDGNEERIHPDDWTVLLEKFEELKRPFQLNVPIRLLQDGQWNWFSFRLKKSAKESTFSGVMIPLNDEINRMNQISELCLTKEKVYRALGHDLKGQFSSLYGFSDILLNSYKELDETSRLKYIGYMKTISSNTHLLVDNMLNWAKLKQGQIDIQKRPLLFSDKLDEVVGYIQYALESKNIKLKRKFDPRILVFADSVLLTSVLLNILTNAVKFSHQGQSLVVSAVEKHDGVRIKIQDSGVGMPTELIHLIFDPETLVTKKGTSNESGTGLGLKISKEFIQLMDGKLTIQSKVEKGTKITLYLPLLKD